MTLVNDYWRWIADARSSNRAERLRAEQDARPFLDVQERIGQSESSAVEVILALLSVVPVGSDWHYRVLAYGPLEDAVSQYGQVIVVNLRSKLADGYDEFLSMLSD